MLSRRILQLVPTLGTLLLQADTLCCLQLHREGGQAVPSHVIKEARALSARYRHVLTQQDTQRRIIKQAAQHEQQRKRQRENDRGERRRTRRTRRDLQSSSLFSTQLMEEHLFQPIQPQADNEQIDDGTSTTHDNTRNTISLRQVGLEGSATPLFFCSHCDKTTQHDLEECARCKGFVLAQQKSIEEAVLALFPQAHVVAATQRLLNIVFVEMPIAPHDDIAEMDHALSQIGGVLKIIPQEDSTLEDDAAVTYMGGGTPLEQRFCGVGGKGVRLSILDSGVDYTHERIGGAGTTEAYELAYGTGPDSVENKQVNPDVFPTETVIGGKDFLGESFVHTAESIADDAIPDGNPVDANRHGTMVADAILSVAPQTKLFACKVCTSDTGTCPGFAVLQALEYSLDPNGDDNIDDKVDIVNLSLGGSYLSSYYDLRTEAMERVFTLGVLPVVAAGNEGNIPFIGGPGAKTPNAMSVAATNAWTSGAYSMVAGYSSRGPGDENILKPDISAPSGLTLAAYGTGNEFYRGVQGTSFAAPIVAGALALVKERCPNCSPFALKAILMNNAKRHVQYHTPNTLMNGTTVPTDDAPNSLVGAGEVQLDKSLDADIWAYCVEDTQASLSFGLINAHKETTLKKTIKVLNLSGKEQTLRIRNQFATKALTEPQENPLIVSFSPQEQVLAEGCNTQVEFEVTLLVDASKAPPNRMTSGGEASNDPTNNDWNEFGGWIVIENAGTSKDISLAYHSIIRQASDLTIQGSRVIENFSGGPTQVNIGLTNLGAGVAQVDAFELLFTSEDDPEGGYGEEITPSDFRYIGYRVFQPEGQAGTCDYLLEFSFTTWEKQKRLNLEFFQVHIDTNLDNNVDYILFNSGVFTPFTDNIGCVVRDKSTGAIKCTGFAPDHSTNTGNTILRVCSNDIGFAAAPTSQQRVNVYILTATATHLGVTEVTDRASEQFHTIEFPQAWISAPSYDIYSGETLETIEIDGTGGDGTSRPLGLMLVTNAYRGVNNTGAASPESETIILTNGQQILPTEVTPDDLIFPVAEALQGPECVVWEDVTSCATSRSGESVGTFSRAFSAKSTSRNPMGKIHRMYREESSDAQEVDEPEAGEETKGALHAVMQSSGENEAAKCPEIAVPRSQILGVPRSAPAPTAPNVQSPPTLAPSQNGVATGGARSPAPTAISSRQSEVNQTSTPTANSSQNATAQPSTPQSATIPTSNDTDRTTPQPTPPTNTPQPTAIPNSNNTAPTTAQPTDATNQNGTSVVTQQPSANSPSVNLTSGSESQSNQSAAQPATVQPTPPQPTQAQSSNITLAPSGSTQQGDATNSNATQNPTSTAPVSLPPSSLPPTFGTQAPTSIAPVSLPPSTPVPTSTAPVSLPPSPLPPSLGTPLPTTSTPQTVTPSGNNTDQPMQTPAPIPLRLTVRPTGPVAAAIDLTRSDRFKAAVSPIFSGGVSQSSPVFALGLGAAGLFLSLTC